jgi:hypothetical protein
MYGVDVRSAAGTAGSASTIDSSLDSNVIPVRTECDWLICIKVTT